MGEADYTASDYKDECCSQTRRQHRDNEIEARNSENTQKGRYQLDKDFLSFDPSSNRIWDILFTESNGQTSCAWT